MGESDGERLRNTDKGRGKKEGEELRTVVYQGLKSEIIKYYNAEEIEYKDLPAERMLNDFFAYLYRLIPAVKRNVFYSNELKHKIDAGIISKDQASILYSFENGFKAGENMNIYLSKKTRESRNTDFLLYSWHLFHLHLSDKKCMKNNRSATQLICIVTSNEVYFVDVIVHPQKAYEYFDIQHLRIIINNGWINKIGFYAIPGRKSGSLDYVITDSKELFEMYSSGVNLAFEFDGVGYASINPIMSSKCPWVVTETIININKKIFELREKRENCVGVKMANNNGFLAFVVAFKTDETGMLECYDLMSKDLICYSLTIDRFQNGET